MTLNVHMATPTKEGAQENSKPNKYERIKDIRKEAEMIKAIRYCQKNDNEARDLRIKEIIGECSKELKQEILESCKGDMNSFINKKFDDVITELKKKETKEKKKLKEKKKAEENKREKEEMMKKIDELKKENERMSREREYSHRRREFGERINWSTKCYACGKTGHLARNCRELNKRDSSVTRLKR